MVWQTPTYFLPLSERHQGWCRGHGLSTSSPWDSVVSQRCSALRTACEPTLLINNFVFHTVIFKSDQLPNPTHWAAAQTLPAGDLRGRNCCDWELHQLDLLFRGVLHFQGKQFLSSKGSCDITTGWMVTSPQAFGNLGLDMIIISKEINVSPASNRVEHRTRAGRF